VQGVLEMIDDMGALYTQILLYMGKNSSNVFRIVDVGMMLYNRCLNVSRKDFDALLLSVSNLVFSLFIMYSADQSDAVDRSLFLSMALSLSSLLFFLCYEKAMMMAHYDLLTDMNAGRLNKLEILLYIGKLKEDFLVEDVNYEYVNELLKADPPSRRAMPPQSILPTVDAAIHSKGLFAFAKALILEEGVKSLSRNELKEANRGKIQKKWRAVAVVAKDHAS